MESVLKQKNNHGFSFADVGCFKIAQAKHWNSQFTRKETCLISKIYKKKMSRKVKSFSIKTLWQSKCAEIYRGKITDYLAPLWIFNRGERLKVCSREVCAVSAKSSRGQCCCSCWPGLTWMSGLINVCISFRMLQEICHEIVWDWPSLYFKCHHFTSQPCQAACTVGWPVCSRMKWLSCIEF